MRNGRRWWFAFLLLPAGCVVVEGPCKVTKAQIICEDGGKVHVMQPSRTIEASGKAAEHIVQAIAEDPAKVDPRLLVPPRLRR